MKLVEKFQQYAVQKSSLTPISQRGWDYYEGILRDDYVAQRKSLGFESVGLFARQSADAPTDDQAVEIFARPDGVILVANYSKFLGNVTLSADRALFFVKATHDAATTSQEKYGPRFSSLCNLIPSDPDEQGRKLYLVGGPNGIWHTDLNDLLERAGKIGEIQTTWPANATWTQKHFLSTMFGIGTDTSREFEDKVYLDDLTDARRVAISDWAQEIIAGVFAQPEPVAIPPPTRRLTR